MNLTILDDSQYALWDRIADAAAGGGVYARTDYLQVLADVTDGRLRVAGVYDKDQLVGGIAMLETMQDGRRRIGGRYLLYYSGPIVVRDPRSGLAAWQSRAGAVVAEIERYLRSSDFGIVTIRGHHDVVDFRPFADNGWRMTPTWSCVVDIRGDDAGLADRHRNVRRQVRQAESAGLRVWSANDPDAFWRLHAGTCQRKGFSTYLSEPAMQTYLQRVSELGIGTTWFCGIDETAPVATILTLQSRHPVAHMVCAASEEDLPVPGLNAAFRCAIFDRLAASGVERVDLTDAHNPDVFRFKNQLGAQLVTNHEIERPLTPADRRREVVGKAVERGKSIARRLLGRR